MRSDLKREIKEEFGINIKIGDPFYVFTYNNEVKESHSIEVVYFAKFIDPIKNIQLDPEDHCEYDWFAKTKLSKVINNVKGPDDPELETIAKGFQLWGVGKLDFGL